MPARALDWVDLVLGAPDGLVVIIDEHELPMVFGLGLFLGESRTAMRRLLRPRRAQRSIRHHPTLCEAFAALLGRNCRRHSGAGGVFVSCIWCVALEPGNAVVSVVARASGAGPRVDAFEAAVGGCPTSSAVPT